jgi:hypothetical protein
MADAFSLQNLAWAATTFSELVLFQYLLRRGLFRSHPAFTLYVLAAIVQSLVMVLVYRYLDPNGLPTYIIAWSGQAVVVSARALAVAEISRKIFSSYAGIRKMTSGVLLVVGACVLIYAFASSGKKLGLMVLNADRAVELSIAAFVVAMLLFARYYRVPVTTTERLLAIGFCLYSCFHVINDSVYESWHTALGSLWSFLDIVTFLASVFLWIRAARSADEPQKAAVAAPLSREKYGELSLQLNSRLELLNSRLRHLLRSGDTHP